MKKRSMIICALALSAVMLVPATAHAADAENSIKYGTVTKTQQKVLIDYFDADFYAAANPDVVKAVGNTKEALFNHFVNYGIFEERSLSEDFDVAAYKSSYTDLADAYKDDIVAYFMHYAEHGKEENRQLVTIEKAVEAGVKVKSVVSGEPVAKAVALEEKIEAEKAAAASKARIEKGTYDNGNYYVEEYDAQDRLIKSLVYTSEDVLIYDETDTYYANGDYTTLVYSYDYDGKLELTYDCLWGSNNKRKSATTVYADGSKCVQEWPEITETSYTCISHNYNADGSFLSASKGIYSNDNYTLLSISYDENDEITSWWEYEWNDKGKKAKTIQKDKDGNIIATEEYEYDESGNYKTTRKSGDGSIIQVTEYECDEEGRLLKATSTDADGHILYVAEYEIDENGASRIKSN